MPMKSPVQIAPPSTLYHANLLYLMLPTPAMKGANVRTIGTNRASTTVFPPYFS